MRSYWIYVPIHTFKIRPRLLLKGIWYSKFRCYLTFLSEAGYLSIGFLGFCWNLSPVSPPCIMVHCTMCTLFHTNSAGLLKLGHILKNPKKYFYEHIFFPALTTRRKMESFKFLWFSNSKKWKICDFRVIFPDFECSKNNVSSVGK